MGECRANPTGALLHAEIQNLQSAIAVERTKGLGPNLGAQDSELGGDASSRADTSGLYPLSLYCFTPAGLLNWW